MHEHKQVSRSSLVIADHAIDQWVGAARGGDTMRLARLAYGAVVRRLSCRLDSCCGRAPRARSSGSLSFHVPEAGAALATLGVLLIAAGHPRPDRARRRTTHECLPSAAPRCSTRIYRWVRDPIYIGFVLVCAGCVDRCRSPAGLWIVTPVTALACAAPRVWLRAA
jgi:hypothetical protein